MLLAPVCSTWRTGELQTEVNELAAKRDRAQAEMELAQRRTSELKALSDDYRRSLTELQDRLIDLAGHRGRARPATRGAPDGRPRRLVHRLHRARRIRRLLRYQGAAVVGRRRMSRIAAARSVGESPNASNDPA